MKRVERNGAPASAGRPAKAGAPLLILAIAAFYVTAVLWIMTDSRASQHVYDESSAANTSESGVSLAYSYLQRHRHVEMLTRPVSTDSLAQRGVVFRIGKAIPPDFLEEPTEGKKEIHRRPSNPLLTSDEAEWVERGGRMVLAMTGDLGPLRFRGDTGPVAHKVFPFAPGIERLSLPERRGLSASTLGPRMLTMYISGKAVVVAREVFGAGDIIVVALPEMFHNKHLGVGNHLPFLVALAGVSRPVYFDEYVHGLGSADGALDLMKAWRLGPFLLLVLGASLLALWRGASRVGPPEEEYRDARSEAVDLVASLGALYQRSMTDAEALKLYQEALTRSVAAQSGLRGDALHQRVAELLGGRVQPRELSRGLQRINAAFGKLAKRRAGLSGAPAPSPASRRRGGGAPLSSQKEA